MWGPREGIEEAKGDLYKLGQFALRSAKLSEVTKRDKDKSKNKEDKKLDKINAPPTEVQAERIAKSEAADAKREHYKQPPEDPAAFPVVVRARTLP